MIFPQPIPFAEALASRRVKTILPTSATSGQLMALAPALRERAMFSARTTHAGYLQRMHKLLTGLASPETVIDDATGAQRPARPGEYLNPAVVRTQLKEALKDIGYRPDPADRGTLRDLSSDRRIDLIIDTNTKMAHGYGNWAQGQNDTVLDQWPAQELYRAEAREIPRDWYDRWRSAGGSIMGGGRMIALKNDPIWTSLSRFGLPYPPFDFNSGMDVRDVDRNEAIQFGLIDRDTRIPPQERPFNQDVSAASPVAPSDPLYKSIIAQLGDAVIIANGVLHLISQ